MTALPVALMPWRQANRRAAIVKAVAVRPAAKRAGLAHTCMCVAGVVAGGGCAREGGHNGRVISRCVQQRSARQAPQAVETRHVSRDCVVVTITNRVISNEIERHSMATLLGGAALLDRRDDSDHLQLVFRK
jgi:hypothetical protein